MSVKSNARNRWRHAAASRLIESKQSLTKPSLTQSSDPKTDGLGTVMVTTLCLALLRSSRSIAEANSEAGQIKKQKSMHDFFGKPPSKDTSGPLTRNVLLQVITMTITT